MRRRERQLALAQRFAGLGAWEWDLERDRFRLSEELYAIVGVRPGALEASFESYRRMVYPADRAAFDGVIHRALERKESSRLEHRVVRPDGEVRAVRATFDVQLDLHGRVAQVHGFVQDATASLEAERRKEELLHARFAKDQARSAEKHVREVLEAIPQQVWVADAAGGVRMVNERVSTYFDTAIDSLASDALRRAIHPEDYERALAAWRRARDTRSTLSVEIRLKRASDGAFRWHLCRAEPQIGPTGRVERWIGTNTDVHAVREAEAERARAEREARLERRRLRMIFERAPAAICITRGADHSLIAANAAFRWLLPGRDGLGRPMAEGFPELAAEGLLPLLDRVYQSGRPYFGREVPLRYPRRSSGTLAEIYFHLVLLPLADTDGAIEGILLHAVDVTDMVHARLAVEDKAAELEELTHHLEVANGELDRFAYVTSHDLRAPLRGISNLAQWIEEDLHDSASGETRQHLELLRGRVRRLEKLIDGILQYSRAGRFHGPQEEVDVGRLIDEVADLLDPPADARIRAVAPLPVLVTERVPLAQVLQNLIDNALTHGRGVDGARVRVSVERVDGALTFAVADSGPGIDARFHERIWGMFQTLNSDRGDAAGIGLPLVRKIVEGRGGRVWVESSPGAGATFRFTWPTQPRARRPPSGRLPVVGSAPGDG